MDDEYLVSGVDVINQKSHPEEEILKNFEHYEVNFGNMTYSRTTLIESVVVNGFVCRELRLSVSGQSYYYFKGKSVLQRENVP